MRTTLFLLIVSTVFVPVCTAMPNEANPAKVDVKTLKKAGEYIRGERIKLPDKFRAQQIKDMKFGMFICWSFSTFSGMEWTATLDKDATYFRATGCDTDQWCKTAKEAGMGYILFLSKHHDGFCLWDTATTDKKVTHSPIGVDVLAKLRQSCDKYGIKLALYFSEGDWNWPGAVDRASQKGGSNPEAKKAQLQELCTKYGPIEFFWMDHAAGTGGLSHEETVQWVHEFQPNCFVGFNHGKPAGRLSLREMGRPGPIGDAKATVYNKEAEGKYQGYLAAEFTYPIQPPHKGGAMWFYSLPRHDGLCHMAEKLYLDYAGAVKHGNIFSINVGPDYAGKLRAVDVTTLQEVGKYISGELLAPDASLAQGKPAQASGIWGPGYEADKAFDGNSGTRWGAPEDSRKGWLEVDLQGEVLVSRVVIDEGDWDRVTGFELLIDQNGTWTAVAQGNKIGPNKTLTFNAVKTRKVRLNILEATEVPTIQEIEVHKK